MFLRGLSRRGKVGALTALLVVPALAVGLVAAPAHADGGTVAAVPTIVATSNGGTIATCDAAASAAWFVYPEGDAAITFEASTTCSRAMRMTGLVELIPNGAAMPVQSGSFAKLLATSGTAYGGAYATMPGEVFAVRYTTTVWANIGFSWTTVPPQCTVTPASPGPKITCSVITFVTVS